MLDDLQPCTWSPTSTDWPSVSGGSSGHSSSSACAPLSASASFILSSILAVSISFSTSSTSSCPRSADKPKQHRYSFGTTAQSHHIVLILQGNISRIPHQNGVSEAWYNSRDIPFWLETLDILLPICLNMVAIHKKSKRSNNLYSPYHRDFSTAISFT